jgi:hypothetical protein
MHDIQIGSDVCPLITVKGKDGVHWGLAVRSWSYEYNLEVTSRSACYLQID